MGNEKAKRIQTSLLGNVEKKILVYLAERQPAWMTSDILTYIGVLGAVVCAAGFIMGHININWLWLANGGLVINWYGDSLDGTLARVRKTQRPRYGFFIDHSLDSVTVAIMCIGAGLSPEFNLDVALLVLVGYLMLSIYTYVCTIVNDQFRIAYGIFGPTEFRIIFIVMNIIYMYTPLHSISWPIAGTWIGVYDIAGLAIVAVIGALWLEQFITDRALLDKEDPIKK